MDSTVNMNNLLLKRLLDIILIISSGCFTFFLSLSDSPIETAAGVLISMGIFSLLIFKYDLTTSIYRSMKVETILVAFLMAYYSMVYVNENFIELPMGEMTGDFIYGNVLIYTILYLLLAVFVVCMTMLISNAIIGLLIEFYKSLTRIDKYVLAFGTFAAILLITYLYSNTTGFYSSFDKVYSIDAGYCTRRIFPQLYYADIRHVNFSIITFPIYAIANGMRMLLGDLEIVEHVVIALINTELLLISGILLRKMTKNNYVLALYLASSPAILFSIFIEKYNIATFLLVMVTFCIYKNREGLRDTSSVLAIGAISTSIFICFSYFVNKNIKKAFQELVILGVKFLSLLIIFGRINFLLHVYSKTTGTLGQFASESLNFFERILASFDAVASCFFVQPLKTVGDIVTWESIGESLNIVGVIIVAVSVIGFIHCRKEKYAPILGGWSIFLFILFTIIGWSPSSSPLFALYFTWSYVPLFVMGIEKLFKNRQFYKHAVLTGVILVSVLLNVYHINTLLIFLKETFPI